MKIAPEISYRNIRKRKETEELILRKVEKLDRVCGYINSCHVTIEAPRHRHAGNPFQVRVVVKLPPGHELVVRRDSAEGGREEMLPTMLRNAFASMERRIKELVERQRGDVKVHEQSQLVVHME
jgi:ribosome-associated translation inhibitor RaiA